MELKVIRRDVVLEQPLFDLSHPARLCATIVTINKRFKELENGVSVYQNHTKLFQLIKHMKDKKATVVGYSRGLDKPVLTEIDDSVNIYEGNIVFYVKNEEAFPNMEIVPFRIKAVFDTTSSSSTQDQE